MNTVNLSELSAGMIGLTSACGTTLAEFAAVCLEHCSHQTSINLQIGGLSNDVYELHWTPVDDQQRRCYNDLQEATEFGACGIAILLVNKLVGKIVVERSRKGQGFDYWIGTESNNNNVLFNDKSRLEVSGIISGDNKKVSQRVKQKKEQISISNNLAPGYVAIVEFGLPLAHVEVV